MLPLIKYLLQRRLAQLHGDRLTHRFGISHKPGQSAFQFSHVVVNLAGDQLQHLIRRFDAFPKGLVPENRHPGIDIRPLYIRDKPPFKTAAQPLFQPLDILRRLVACQNDLFSGIVQFIEGIEKLLLCAFPPGDKLNVIHHQNINLADSVAKLVGFFLLNRADQFIGEGFACQIKNLRLRVFLQRKVPDRLHQMRFAQPHTAVNEKRIVRVRRILRHCQGRGMGKPVTRTNDKAIKCIFRIQMRMGAAGFSPILRRHSAFRLGSGQDLSMDGTIGHPGQRLFNILLILLHNKIAHCLDFNNQKQIVPFKLRRNQIVSDPGVI